MIKNPKVGDTVYFVENNYRIIEATVKAFNSSFCVLRYEDDKGIRLRHSRLYKSQIEAQNAILMNRTANKVRSPYDYDH